MTQRLSGWSTWRRSRPGKVSLINSVSKPYPPAPLGSELRPDAQGFLTATRKGIADDMAQDLPDTERQILTATQGQTAASVFGATVTKAAWKNKPSWALIAGNDCAIPRNSRETKQRASKQLQSPYRLIIWPCCLTREK